MECGQAWYVSGSDAGEDGLGQVFFMRLQDDGWSVGRKRCWRPPTDAYETEEHVIVKVEVAGMREEDFSIHLADRRLCITGVRHDSGGKQGYQNMEIRYGPFMSELHLSWSVDPDAVEAVYEHGFLYVRLPKAPRRVPVRVVPADK